MYRAFLIFFLSIVALASTVAAQDATRPDETATLKQRLIELENKQTQLRLRLEELDEALKPESIERALAGIGSTRPEELREHRRKMLTIERNGLQTQLNLIEESRARTESAIAAAESATYLKYAQTLPTPSMQLTMVPNMQSVRSLLHVIFLSVAVLIFVFAGMVSILSRR
jgi:hypothetical protein